jgi:hypothetical protein
MMAVAKRATGAMVAGNAPREADARAIKRDGQSYFGPHNGLQL